MIPAIEIRGLSKSFGAVKALDGISLSVGEGELFGLIGPDGAGKSTLYRILATLTRPDGGSAAVSGLDTGTDARTLRRLIGYMPEKFSLYPDLTVMENLRFFASLSGVSVKENLRLIAPVFEQLAKFPDRKAGALSGGMKQKLALSCALIHRPSVLLLDEPTTGVDPVSRTEFWETLAILRNNGMTILVSTSYMDEATRCDRIAIIDQGRIEATGTPGDLAAGIGRGLYNAEAPDMFRLLSALRRMPGILDCYTFGATLRIAAAPSFDTEATLSRLAAEGLAGVRIYPAKGTIEDLFIKLTRNEG